MYRRALEGKEKAWGPEHTSTLSTVNNLRNLYTDQGRMKEAEDIYLRALAGYEKTCGPEHTSILNTVNKLGILYSDQGRIKEAEDMYLRALVGYEKTWGPEHTSTFDIANNLGLLYSNQGKLSKAEEMYLRALAGYENALGLDHPSTLDVRASLDVLYNDIGKESTESFQRPRRTNNELSEPIRLETMAAKNLELVDNWEEPEIQSLPSLTEGSTLLYTSPVASEELEAADEFAALLLSDATLRPLFSKALDEVTMKRFDRNIAKLLKLFALDLGLEASNALEKDAVQLLRKRAWYIVRCFRQLLNSNSRD
jgi:tetratricopeptide (TPR) repeat protein